MVELCLKLAKDKEGMVEDNLKIKAVTVTGSRMSILGSRQGLVIVANCLASTLIVPVVSSSLMAALTGMLMVRIGVNFRSHSLASEMTDVADVAGVGVGHLLEDVGLQRRHSSSVDKCKVTPSMDEPGGLGRWPLA